jgi:hypothetical protein
MAQEQALSLSPQTLRSVRFVELRQSLPSQVALISPFVDQLMRFIAKCRDQLTRRIAGTALPIGLLSACALFQSTPGLQKQSWVGGG